MKTIAFFNNKGGVGKTTLVYHVAWRFAQMGRQVLVADLDPQANVTAMMLDYETMEKIDNGEIKTIYDYISESIFNNSKEIDFINVTSKLAIILGDLRLSELEDKLSNEWTNGFNPQDLTKKGGIKSTSAIYTLINEAAKKFYADYILIDIGPNLGAINRSALISSDYVIVPVSPDIYSIQGLKNVGKTLGEWKEGWKQQNEKKFNDISIAKGNPVVLGYIVSRFSILGGGLTRWYGKWIKRVPITFREYIQGEKTIDESLNIDNDPAKIAWIKDYRSLIPMSQEAHKPIFLLTPNDGAIGSHQQAVNAASDDFRQLCLIIEAKIKEVESQL